MIAGVAITKVRWFYSLQGSTTGRSANESSRVIGYGLPGEPHARFNELFPFDIQLLL